MKNNKKSEILKHNNAYKSKRYKKPMTLVVGIACKDGLIMASDSQGMSNRGVDVKRMDCTKIEVLSDNGLKSIVGGAGEVPFINKIVDLIKKNIKESRIKNCEELIDCCEEGINEITKKYGVDRLRKIGLIEKTPSVHSERPEPTLNSIIVVGCIDNKKPLLHIILPEGVAEKEENFCSIGSGSAYAEYILSNLFYEDITLKEGILLATHVVEEVKKIDPNVGGDVQIITINSEGIIKEYNKTECNSLCQDISNKNKVLSDVWRSLILNKKTSEQISTFINKD